MREGYQEAIEEWNTGIELGRKPWSMNMYLGAEMIIKVEDG